MTFYLAPDQWACRILVPWVGTEPEPPAVEALSANQWTAGQAPSGLMRWMEVITMLFFLNNSAKQFASSWDIHKCPCGDCDQLVGVGFWDLAGFFQQCSNATLNTSNVFKDRFFLLSCPQSAAAAAKSLQSCPTVWDPIDGRPPGSPVPGILQARTLEWVAIAFSNAWKWKVKVKLLNRVWLSLVGNKTL